MLGCACCVRGGWGVLLASCAVLQSSTVHLAPEDKVINIAGVGRLWRGRGGRGGTGGREGRGGLRTRGADTNK